MAYLRICWPRSREWRAGDRIRHPAHSTLAWTINFDGQGSFYDNKAQAVAAATSMRPRVTQSIDVGCMQISLTNHPDAFASLDQAFDPSANADYGARFLLQLFAKTGSWPKAVEFYHSATPELGHDYGQKVYAVLPEETKLAYGAEPTPFASGWAMTPNRSLLISPMRQIGRLIPRATGLGGEPTPGRTLDSLPFCPGPDGLQSTLTIPQLSRVRP